MLATNINQGQKCQQDFPFHPFNFPLENNKWRPTNPWWAINPYSNADFSYIKSVSRRDGDSTAKENEIILKKNLIREFDGILNYFYNLSKNKNPFDEGLIIGASSNRPFDRELVYLIIDDKPYINHTKQPQMSSNAWIQFDFKDNRVSIYEYAIQTGTGMIGNFFPKSWALMGSNDKDQWEIIDKRINDTNLNNASVCKVFPTLSIVRNRSYRYIRYYHYDSHSESMDRYSIMYFQRMEFYGKIIFNNSQQ